jgi:TonB family protein
MPAGALNFYMTWGVANDDDRRFNRIARNNLLIVLVLGLVMPFLPLPEINKPLTEEEPPRLAKLIFEKEVIKPPPPPKVEVKKPLPKKVEKPKPVKKPEKKKVVVKKPKPVKPKVTARQKAQKSGLLALSDSLSDLRQNTNTKSFTNKNLSQAGGKASKTERSVLTAGTTSSSGGIKTASMSRNTGGGSLAGRSTTSVHSPTGNAETSTVGGKGKGSRGAGRSIEEIQMIFDRNKGSIYSVYNRALRKNPTLQGKVVLRLTIAPSGKVTRCDIVSSELGDPALASKITSRVKLFNFGAKDVKEVTITYPIDFLPA